MSSVAGLVGRVRRIAGGFRDAVRGEDRRDLEQDGMLGLLEAATRYRPDGGASLTTFGGRRALGAMRDRLRVLARQSRETPCEDVGSVSRAAADGFTARNLESSVRVLRFSRFLRSEFRRLERPERDVVRMRFFEGASLREVAETLGVSVATALRLERKGLDLLRERFLAGGYRL